MESEHFPITLYDELGSSRFRDLSLKLLRRVYGEGSLLPFPSKGKDGGIDAKKIRTSQSPINFQFKWREVARYNPTTLQSNIKKEFKEWVEKMARENSPSEGVFITNVALTGKTHKFFEQIIKQHEQRVKIDYWDFERLNQKLKIDQDEDLKEKYFPRRTREEYNIIKKELEKLKRTKRARKPPSQEEVKDAKERLQTLFIDLELKYKYYYPFIDLLEPFYLDRRGAEKRKKLRKLFSITEKEERKFIKKMVEINLIKIVGDLCIINDQERAEKLQNEMLDRGTLNLEIITKLFS